MPVPEVSGWPYASKHPRTEAGLWARIAQTRSPLWKPSGRQHRHTVSVREREGVKREQRTRDNMLRSIPNSRQIPRLCEPFGRARLLGLPCESNITPLISSPHRQRSWFPCRYSIRFPRVSGEALVALAPLCTSHNWSRRGQSK